MQKSKLSVVLVVLAVVMAAGTSFASPPILPAPDAGSSALLMSMALGGLAFVRKFVR
jgi:hypothetical protein